MTDFLQAVAMVFVALIPPVNPPASALMLDPMLSELTDEQRRYAAKRITTYCFIVCLVATVMGQAVLKIFGISLPIVQLAGGLLICRMGWNMLGDNTHEEEKQTHFVETGKDLDQMLFYPFAFPMMTGAGTMSVLFTLGAQREGTTWGNYFLHMSAMILAIVLMMGFVYVFVAHTHSWVQRMGKRATLVINKVASFLVLCVGMQIAFNGLPLLLDMLKQ